MSDLSLALLDACELGPWYRLPSPKRRVLLMRGVAVFAFLLTARASPGIAWPDFFSSEDRAAHFLLAIGPSQLAYQDANLDKVYGSFAALQLTGYLEPELTPWSAIPDYSLNVIRSEPYYGHGCGDSSFTMVAMPRKKRLRTFAMCDDQTLRWCDQQPNILPCNWTPVEEDLVARLKESGHP